jgi:MFS family permease
MIGPCALLTGILSLCLIAAHSTASVVVIIALYGFTSGTFVSLPPTVFVALTTNRALTGTRMGMGFAFASFGMLMGTPISGAILDSTGGKFEYVWIFGGTLTVVGSLFILACRVAQGGTKLIKKV